WAVEGFATYGSRVALEERGGMASWEGEIAFRVVENDGEEALLDATIRTERFYQPPCRWSIRYSLEPFAIVAARTEALTRAVDAQDYVFDPAERVNARETAVT